MVVISFSLKKTVTSTPKLLIEDTHMKKEHATKFLGVFIDENWSWKQHIQKQSSGGVL